MIKEFSFLRVVLISIIFLHHIGVYQGGGAIAVCCFFILSGFCSAISYKDKVISPHFNYLKYILSRCVKYYPVHWLTLILFIFLLQGGALGSLKYFMVNASLLQSWIPQMSVYFSYNAVSWYLCNTIFFVAVLPIILKLLVKQSNRILIFLGAGLIVSYLCIFIFIPEEYYHSILYINPLTRLLDFTLGLMGGGNI